MIRYSGVARVTGARGKKEIFAPPPPLQKILRNEFLNVYSIQLIMFKIISRSLHVYFTTFDMILKYILTYSTCKINPPSYKSCKTIYKILGEGNACFFSCENFIAHSFLWGLWEMFVRKKNRKKMDFGTFWCIFQYFFVLKVFIAYL